MVDVVDPATRSRMMSGIRNTGTKPERAVRSALHARGFRFSHSLKLTGRPDAVLPKWKVAIFVHGCFWHAHGCSLTKLPSSNTEFWRAKLDANVARDARSSAVLLEEGWRIAIIWECAMRSRTAAEQFQPSMDELALWITASAGTAQLVIPKAGQI